MKTTNKLKWESEVGDSAKGWVTVVPTTGDGDTRVTINVDNEDGWADPDTLSGTVTFRCTNCKSTDITEKTIDVCRCACSCCDLSVTPSVTTVPENGLAEGSAIGSYNLLSRCGASKISGTITKNGGVEQSLKFENGTIKLINAIPYNQQMSQATYTIKIFFDKGNLPETGKCDGCCNPCKTWTITQDALDCNCDNTVKGKITYSSYFTGTEIPQSGLDVGTELFTYNIKQFCPDNLLTAEVKYGTSTVRTVTVSGGKGILNQSIGSNDNTSKRDITIKVSYNGEECETKTGKQIGCTCSNVLPNDESFVVSIPTFKYADEGIAVKVGDIVGSYVKKAGTSCPETAITATLVSNGVTYPLSCSDGKVKLTGSTNILENASHDGIPFIATVYYNGEECDSDQITQPGVACNCDDIRGKVSQFNIIPKTGATAGFVLGTYSLAGTQCSDANDCMKIEEVNGLVGAKFQNGKVITTTDIGNNEDPLVVTFSFKISYKVNDKWRECSTITTTQKGMECSCASISVTTESEVSEFPYAGTHGEWVTFASGDTGLYKYKGTPQQEFAGVCGKLLAVTESGYLNKDEEQEVEDRVSQVGDYIRVIGVKLTEEEREVIVRNQGEEYLVPHKYLLQVNIKEITGIEDKLSLVPVLYFYKRVGTEWVEEKCTDKRCLFYISDAACDCNKKPDLTLSSYANPVKCEGTGGVIQLGYISNKHADMTITAELLDPDNSLIDKNTFTASTDTYGRFSISGKVDSVNDTGDIREVGTIRVTYICNKNKPNEWSCGYKDFVIKQEKCPVCDCDYIKDYCPSYYYSNVEVHLPHDSRSTSEALTSTFKLDCGDLYIEGQDSETGIYTGEWYTANISREYSYYGYYFAIHVSLKEDVEHASRTDTVTIKARWYNTETEQWEDCTSFTATIYDEICDCSSLDGISWNMTTGETLTISAGSSYGDKYLQYFSVSDCITLFIVGEVDGLYTDPDGYFTARISNYSTYGYVYVSIKKDLNEPKEIVIKGKYKNSNGEWVECDKEFKLTIKQSTCDCNTFKNKVSFDTYFNQNYTTLRVATISSGCGKGKLFVNCDGNDYCVASDLPESMNYITSINGCSTENCKEGTDCCDTSFDLTVTQLQEEESRTINVAVYWCNDDGSLYKDPETGEYCYDSDTITQTFERSCSDVSCYNYTIGIPELYEIDLAAGSSLTKIADYKKLPEKYENCYSISIYCSDERVSDFQYDDTTISMALKSGVTGQVTVDITAKYIDNYGNKTTCQYSQIIVHIT